MMETKGYILLIQRHAFGLTLIALKLECISYSMACQSLSGGFLKFF